MNECFAANEVAALRAQGIAIFADRMPVDLQPPASDARIAELESACAWPLPHALRALRRLMPEDGAAWNDKLRYVPIGGIEYCDRICLVVEPAGVADRVSTLREFSI